MILLVWGDWVCVYLGRNLGVFGVLVVLYFYCVVFSFFVVFCTSSCSGIFVPPALYDLL